MPVPRILLRGRLITLFSGQAPRGPADCLFFGIPLSHKDSGWDLGLLLELGLGIVHGSKADQHQAELLVFIFGHRHDILDDCVLRILGGPRPDQVPGRCHAPLRTARGHEVACQGGGGISINGLRLERPGSAGCVESLEEGNLIGGKAFGQCPSKGLPVGRDLRRRCLGYGLPRRRQGTRCRGTSWQLRLRVSYIF